LLRAGSLAAFAAAVGPAQQAAATPPRGAAKAVILIDLFGGPSHTDTSDPTPDAPDGIRGEFRTIPTVLPGVRVCEHLPMLAQRLNKMAVVRSVTHEYN